MYITVKDKIKFKQYNTTTNAKIDMMFNGIDLETLNLNPETFIPETLVRTKTYIMEPDKVNMVDTRIKINKLVLLQSLVNSFKHKIPNPEEQYKTFRIPKRTSGFRTIDAPLPELKEAQKQIANYITKDLEVLTHDSAWAYTTGRDVVQAMKQHTDNKSNWYLKIDLKDFFGSCSPEFIKDTLKEIYPFCYAEKIVPELLEDITTIACKDEGLPQGTPLSPVLTNLVMLSFDYQINKEIYKLTNKHKLFKQSYIYTRYADDIIISARNKFDFNIIVKAIEKLLKDTPLKINKDKTRFGSSSGRNWNLGIMCNKDNNTTIGYRKKHELKNTIHHYLNDEATWDLDSLRWLLGQLSWLRNVEPKYFNGLMQYYVDKYNFNVWNKIISEIKRYN